MGTPAIYLIATAVIVATSFGTCVSSLAREMADAMRANVVTISVKTKEDSEAGVGFGVVVGERAGQLTIATANHVVRDPATQLPRGTHIRVRFFGLSNTSEAVLLDRIIDGLDLAAIEVPTPQGLQFKLGILGSVDALKPGDRLWSVGRNRQWIVQGSPGAFRRRSTNFQILEMERLGVQEGSSGSPIVSEIGLVGILTQDGNDQDIRAIPIDVVKNAFARENWNLPWQLRSALKRPPGEVFKDSCAECPELVVIEGASFRMGSEAGVPWPDDASRPAHQVKIGHDFAIGRYEVTNQQWLACVRAGGCSREAGGTIDERIRFPIQYVNWYDAQDYVRWLSRETGQKYRLPTEAEWEFAARGGRTNTYPWGETMTAQAAVCTGCPGDYESSQTRKPAPIGRYAPNGFKLYDMAGNVSEIVEDCWAPNHENAPEDGRARQISGCADRVIRGGSFLDAMLMLRVFARSQFQNGRDRSESIGFRIVRDLEP